MSTLTNLSETGLTRRSFLTTSSKAAAGAALAASVPRPGYTAESNTIKLALIGCGGRGTGAIAQALSTQGPTELWAMVDVFEQRLQTSLKVLQKKLPDKAKVPAERRWLGLDGYKKAIDSMEKGSVVLLTTPPAFRPIHAEYAISKGMHVFMEKSFGVDGPGVRRILAAGEEAKRKNLKIAGGLMTRHSVYTGGAVEQIHGGKIGEVIATWAYRMHGPVGYKPRQEGMNELAFQISNYSNFTWLNGSFLLDWLIHNLDVACWVKDEWPVSVQGMGGRQTRKEADQLFDHYAAEYTFADGTRLDAQGRHISRCFDYWGVFVQGTTGCAELGEGIKEPRLFKGHKRDNDKVIWTFTGQKTDPYQYEHDLFFDAIRNDKPHNEAERCAKTCLTGIMGRMACETGEEVTWDKALNSKEELAPGLENLTMDSDAPVKPDTSGQYPVAMPGTNRVI